jgi:hypothetical protein
MYIAWLFTFFYTGSQDNSQEKKQFSTVSADFISKGKDKDGTVSPLPYAAKALPTDTTVKLKVKLAKRTNKWSNMGVILTSKSPDADVQLLLWFRYLYLCTSKIEYDFCSVDA